MIVLIETPWDALEPTVAKDYLRSCIRDALLRGEVPLSRAALINLTEALNTQDPDQKFEIKKVHNQMVASSGLVAFYEDQGWSKAMVKVTEWAHAAKIRVVRRKVF